MKWLSLVSKTAWTEAGKTARCLVVGTVAIPLGLVALFIYGC